MSNLILHVGHPKTGTSYLQSLIALNEQTLKKHNIYYPFYESYFLAKKGKPTSGNGEIFKKFDFKSKYDQTILFSSEDLFRILEWKHFYEIAENYSQNLKIILYTRNLFDYTFSSWGQKVKRAGEIRDLNAYLLDVFSEAEPNIKIRPYENILKWLDISKKYGFKIIIRNYSNNRENLDKIFFQDILNINKIDFNLVQPQIKNINRSLTIAEYNLQRVFNSIDGKISSIYISDELIYRLPNIKIQSLKCSEEAYNVVVEKSFSTIEKINNYLNISDKIKIEKPDEVVSNANQGDFQGLSLNQIEVIAAGLKKRDSFKFKTKLYLSLIFQRFKSIIK
jgi:hypothetical protein